MKKKIIIVEPQDKLPKKLSDEELKKHISPYWKKASEAGKEQRITPSMADRPLI